MKGQSLWRSEMLPEKEGVVSVACSISLTGHSSRTKSKSPLLWKCTILAVQKSIFFFYPCATLLLGEKDYAVEICRELCVFWRLS